MTFGPYRFILVKGEGDFLKIRYADALRRYCREDDPARQDDDAFALALMESISTGEDAEEITLNVFTTEEEERA